MSTNHGNIYILRIQSLTVGNEGIGTADIKCGNSNELIGVVLSSLLQYLGGNGYGGVDGVANNGYQVE